MASTDFVNTQNNIIYKVAFFIREYYEVSSGVRIELQKNIPVAAGLGGGSSNAAATIRALSRLWELGLDHFRMHEIATRFGSDINFFLEGGCALGEDRGQIITPLPDCEIDNILLVNPGFGISSEEAYNAGSVNTKPGGDWSALLHTRDTRLCYNALEKGITRRFPLIGKLILEMKELGAVNAILSGSGPTVIGFFSDSVSTIRASEHFTRKNFWNYITKTNKRRTR